MKQQWTPFYKVALFGQLLLTSRLLCYFTSVLLLVELVALICATRSRRLAQGQFSRHQLAERRGSWGCMKGALMVLRSNRADEHRPAGPAHSACGFELKHQWRRRRRQLINTRVRRLLLFKFRLNQLSWWSHYYARL